MKGRDLDNLVLLEEEGEEIVCFIEHNLKWMYKIIKATLSLEKNGQRQSVFCWNIVRYNKIK